MATMRENIAAASKERLQELVALLVERVETAEQHVVRVEWTAPARPFFAVAHAGGEGAAALLWRPRTDSGTRRPTARTACRGTPTVSWREGC